jgi:hypothetical protein
MSIANILGALGAAVGRARLSVDEEIFRKLAPDAPLSVTIGATTKGRLLTTAEIMKCYGQPGDPDNLTVITVPYPFRIAWQPNKTTDRITCHKKIAVRLNAVFRDLLAHYGAEKIKELGIDLFGGCLNFRPQRGLEKKYEAALKAKKFELAYTYLSRHSWATAIDLDPARNALKTKAPVAQFSKPEYKAMNDIFYKHGFIGYGRERNNDWMHFEIGVLIPDNEVYKT